MRSVPKGVGPGHFASEQGSPVRKTFRGHESFEGGEPVFVVMGTVVRVAATGSGLELFGQSRGPFLNLERCRRDGAEIQVELRWSARRNLHQSE